MTMAALSAAEPTTPPGGTAVPRPAKRHRRLLPRQLTGSPLALLALGMVAAWIAVAFLAPALAPYGPLAQSISGRLEPPNAAHWLGTDPLGRDILSRILYGARLSIPVGMIAVALAVVLGTIVGGSAGFLGGTADEAIMRATDLMLAFPTVILALVITAALGSGIRNAVIAIMVAWWPSYARLVRGIVLSLRDREYVMAAQALGGSRLRIFLRHVLPGTISPVIILGTLDVGHAILTFASLSFLGLGPPPQIPEWGSMIASGRNYLDQWWISTFPGLAILTLVLAFNVLGDGLRDLLDPRYRSR
jgi:peptide/nickel transport system permease protein